MWHTDAITFLLLFTGVTVATDRYLPLYSTDEDG